MWTFPTFGARSDSPAVLDPSSAEESITIATSPTHVMAAFFDPHALAEWWGVRHSVTTPRHLGIYAVHWGASDVHDDLLGPLGGTFYGTVIDHRPDREFFLADAYWLPPEGDPVGPMVLHVTCEASGSFAWLHVKQSGCDDSARWRRYYRVITDGWRGSLASLKRFLEEDLTITRRE